MSGYHDREWGVPQRDGRMLWEMLMLEGFQAGLSWITVLRKREAFRAAFAGFDPVKVARFGAGDVRPGIKCDPAPHMRDAQADPYSERAHRDHPSTTGERLRGNIF